MLVERQTNIAFKWTAILDKIHINHFNETQCVEKVLLAKRREGTRKLCQKMDNYTDVDDINQTKCSSGVSTTFTVALSIVSLLAITGNLLVIVHEELNPS